MKTVMDDQPRIEIIEVPPADDALPAEHTDSVLSFFTIGGLDNALRQSGYSVVKETLALSQIVADDKIDPEVRMGAIRMLREHLMTGMQLCGGIQQIAGTLSRTLPNGAQLDAQITGSRLMSARDTERMLEMALQTSHVLEAPKVTVMEDTDVIDADTEQTSPGTEQTGQPGSTQGGSQAAGIGSTALARRPTRDLGGGGLCASSQRRAAADRAAAGRDADAAGIDALGGYISPTGGSGEDGPPSGDGTGGGGGAIGEQDQGGGGEEPACPADGVEDLQDGGDLAADDDAETPDAVGDGSDSVVQRPRPDETVGELPDGDAGTPETRPEAD